MLVTFFSSPEVMRDTDGGQDWEWVLIRSGFKLRGELCE